MPIPTWWVAGEALGAIGEDAVPALLRRLARKPQPGEQPPDRFYRGAHQVFHRLAKHTGDHRFKGLLKALQAEEAELHVPWPPRRSSKSCRYELALAVGTRVPELT